MGKPVQLLRMVLCFVPWNDALIPWFKPGTAEGSCGASEPAPAPTTEVTWHEVIFRFPFPAYVEQTSSRVDGTEYQPGCSYLSDATTISLQVLTREASFVFDSLASLNVWPW
jgi:hypothetical protein